MGNILTHGQISGLTDRNHIRLCMRVRLHYKPKPNNYMESCIVKCGRWMERKKRVIPGEVCAECPERDNHYREVVLNVQKSAEVIVVEYHRVLR